MSFILKTNDIRYVPSYTVQINTGYGRCFTASSRSSSIHSRGMHKHSRCWRSSAYSSLINDHNFGLLQDIVVFKEKFPTIYPEKHPRIIHYNDNFAHVYYFCCDGTTPIYNKYTMDRLDVFNLLKIMNNISINTSPFYFNRFFAITYTTNQPNRINCKVLTKFRCPFDKEFYKKNNQIFRTKDNRKIRYTRLGIKIDFKNKMDYLKYIFEKVTSLFK